MTEKELVFVSMRGSGAMMFGFQRLWSSAQYVISARDWRELKWPVWGPISEVESFRLSLVVSLSNPASITIMCITIDKGPSNKGLPL